VRHGDSSSLKEFFFIITADGKEWDEKDPVEGGSCVQVNDRVGGGGDLSWREMKFPFRLQRQKAKSSHL
jgi:hypothetical protein